MPLATIPTGTNSESILSSAFAITASLGTYEDTGLSTSIPGPGTYMLFGVVRSSINLSSGTSAFLAVKLYNSTDAADVSSSVRLTVFVGQTGLTIQGSLCLVQIVTFSGAKTIQLHAKRDSGGAPTFAVSQIESSEAAGRTSLGFIKLSP